MSRPQFNPEPAFRYTDTLNPQWTTGDGLDQNTPLGQQWKEAEGQGFKVIDPATVSPKSLYSLMISAIVPRPVAFVSSISATGVLNLAPFSYFGMICHDPPLISVSFTSGVRDKDTCLNIKATKTFTVNIISEPFVEAASWCSVDTPKDESEWVGSGLTAEPSTIVKPPRVKESAFAMECELYQYNDFSPAGSEKVTATMVLGLVKLFHVRNDVATTTPNSGFTIIDPAKLRAVSRLGGMTFARVGEGFEIKRPDWEKVKEKVQGLKDKKE